MLLRPDAGDLQLILLYTARVHTAVGVAMALPAAVGFALGETAHAWAFAIAAAIAIAVGRGAELVPRPERTAASGHALAAMALAALTAPLPAGLPLLLSGHWAGPLDAYIEALSGLTTAGLTLVQDLDHLPRSLNLWRHVLHVLGGQGLLVLVLTAMRVGGGLGSLFSDEGSRDVVLPSAVSTARFIWRLGLVYGALGTSVMWGVLVAGGMPGWLGLSHAANLFMSAFDTGAFATMSSGVAFYRSPALEAVLLVLMVAGACSLALHLQLWQGRWHALVASTETRVLAASAMAVLTTMAVGLARSGAFSDPLPMLRHSLFQLVSAQTGTGLTTVPGHVLATDWGVLAPGAVVAAMAIGGMAGSSSGGIGAARLATTLKAVKAEIRRVLLPDDAVVVETQHFGTGVRRPVTPAQIRDAAVLLLLFTLVYVLGAIVGLFYDYPLAESLMESVSATASGGFTTGLLDAYAETPLKVVYALQMILGRLQFVAVFALVGYGVAILRGRA